MTTPMSPFHLLDITTPHYMSHAVRDGYDGGLAVFNTSKERAAWVAHARSVGYNYFTSYRDMNGPGVSYGIIQTSDVVGPNRIRPR